ncbi:hypothetical protein WJX84_008545 [Apatococcus fuscideae]|uniref:Virilizer N-terminal domain-containing protein n=1 Tax=Apatococcus fuscideae TaxID=2026836 RepID=A0AAW1SYQ1_9CHLO
MVVKLKDSQVFKNIYVKEFLDDQQEEIRFPHTVCVSGVKIGGVPNAGTEGDAPFIRTTKAVRFEVTPTDTIIIRGRFQTLPLAIYGWTLPPAPGQRLALLPTVESIAPAAAQPPIYAAPPQKAQPGLVLSDLPRPAIQALQKVLPHWKTVGASYRKMQRAGPMPAEALDALLKLTDTSKRTGMETAGGVKDEPENWLANGMDFGDSKDPAASVVMDSQDIGTAAAEMAAAWCGLLTSEVAPRVALDCSVAGLATATLVCACPRFALTFIEKGGVPGLTSILAMYRAPPFALRLAIAALASLVASCGASGCEAVLEWNNLDTAADEEMTEAAAAELDGEAAEQPLAEAADAQANAVADETAMTSQVKEEAADMDEDVLPDVKPDSEDATETQLDDMPTPERLSPQHQEEDDVAAPASPEARDDQNGVKRKARDHDDAERDSKRRTQDNDQGPDPKSGDKHSSRKDASNGRPSEDELGRGSRRSASRDQTDATSPSRDRRRRSREPSGRKERRSSDRRAASQGPDGTSDRTRLKKEDSDSDASSNGDDSVAAPEPATVGCYEQLTRIMLTNMPSKVLETGTSLLHRLQFYELAARFLVAGSQLLDLPQMEDPVQMRDASAMVSEASSALISLAEALSEPWAACEPSQAAIPSVGAATGGWLAELQPPSIDGWALELMAGRQVLPVLAAVLHVPVLYIIGLEQSGSLDSQASAFQAQFSQPLVTGTKQLLAVLTSRPAGLHFLLHHAAAATAIVGALDATNAHMEMGDTQRASKAPPRKGASVEVAGCLATVLTASHALRGLSNPDLEETPGLATLQGLVELLADESKRAAVVDTLVCTQGVLPALARLMEAPMQASKSEAGAAPVASPAALLAIGEANGLQVLERALRCCTIGVAASTTDGHWVAFAGEAIDVMVFGITRQNVCQALCSATLTMSALLQQLRPLTPELSSTACLDALLMVHAAMSSCPEALATLRGQPPSQAQLPCLQARQAAAAALKCWVDREDWQPTLLPTIFSSGSHALFSAPLISAQAPMDNFTAVCLLGDLFPAEWPPAGGLRRGTTHHPAPTEMRNRVAFAKSIEPATVLFRQLIKEAANSESRIMRCGLVRLCARASGLGGGMGMFLAGPLVEELKEEVASSSPLDSRRMLELLVPLVYRPAMKAAFLDLKVAGMLARLLNRLVPMVADSTEAGQLCTMAMEVITILFNPEVCLNPSATGHHRICDECPSTAEAATLMALLMASLPRMGPNAHLAKRVLKGLAAHVPGRLALRHAAAKWQAQLAQQQGAPAPPGQANKEALEWAATQLWQMGEQRGGDSGMQGVCTEVAGILEEVANHQEEEESPDSPAPASAPARFSAAVKSAMVAARAAGLNPSAAQCRSELSESSSAAALIYDSATRMFWRNMQARATSSNVPPLGRTPVQWEVPEEVKLGPPSSYLGPGLAPRKHPRTAALDSMLPSAAAGAAVVKTAEPTKPGNSMLADMPGADLPPVIAPARAGRMGRGRGGAGSSRPASVHVDDFEGKGMPQLKSAVAAKTPTPPKQPPPPAHPPMPTHPAPPVAKPAPPPGNPPASPAPVSTPKGAVASESTIVSRAGKPAMNRPMGVKPVIMRSSSATALQSASSGSTPKAATGVMPSPSAGPRPPAAVRPPARLGPAAPGPKPAAIPSTPSAHPPPSKLAVTPITGGAAGIKPSPGSTGGTNLKWQRTAPGPAAAQPGPSQPVSGSSAPTAEASAATAQGAAQAALDASDRGESAQNIVSALANKEAIMALLQDKVKLANLLQKNPVLMQTLKARLSNMGK